LIIVAGSLVLPAFSWAQAPVQLPPGAAQQNPQTWASFPTMVLEQIYRGPLQDTIIQRWRDPVNSSICYVYMPISAPLVQPAQGNNFVQYGPNAIGSISCINPTQLVQLAPSAPPPAAPARPNTPPGR
jgi:hypothetical protein